ncbi:hypothetical protein ScPMuIL_014678 [Solemya velum]
MKTTLIFLTVFLVFLVVEGFPPMERKAAGVKKRSLERAQFERERVNRVKAVDESRRKREAINNENKISAERKQFMQERHKRYIEAARIQLERAAGKK